VERSDRFIRSISLDFKRDLINHIKWDWKLISLIGARGVGKTTLLLQKAKEETVKSIYISLDDIYFSANKLIDFADAFYKTGGKKLFIDEVHKYPGWAREIKNLYDFYPDLNIVFTGSSIIELLKQDVDLSRRALLYELNGLSYREYLQLQGIASFHIFSLDEVLAKHVDLANEITTKIHPLEYFSSYLTHGYYPYFLEGTSFYADRLSQVIQLVIESDLDFIPGYDPRNARKILQLFYILATNVPFKPNISSLSEKIGVHRNTLIQYLHHLEKARLINSLYPAGISVSTLQKPEKIFLQNTNIAFALSKDVNKGSLRETFFLNQVKAKHFVSLPKSGDFFIDDKYTIEVGGAKKSIAQIKQIEHAYIAADNIEIGNQNKIPLWLFGFLY
ncbi:MAG: AAA family ATPase, partial [Bacteroidota bacterium]